MVSCTWSLHFWVHCSYRVALSTGYIDDMVSKAYNEKCARSDAIEMVVDSGFKMVLDIMTVCYTISK